MQVLLLMRNLTFNLCSPDFEPVVSISIPCFPYYAVMAHKSFILEAYISTVPQKDALQVNTFLKLVDTQISTFCFIALLN